MLTSQAQVPAKTSPYLITGFDDVLRQAENTGLIRAALKVFEPDKTFSGMPELYQEISRDETDPKFVLVSAISHWFDGRIEKFLNDQRYPAHERMLRNWLTQWSISGFKMERIDEIIARHPGREFIVIFDNSDPSLSMARELRHRSPRIRKVYLRRVVEKPLPVEATGFYTAFEIALFEFEEGRLEAKAVRRVAQAILNETNKELLFPGYALCPKNYAVCGSSSFEPELCARVELHVRRFCQ